MQLQESHQVKVPVRLPHCGEQKLQALEVLLYWPASLHETWRLKVGAVLVALALFDGEREPLHLMLQ